MEQFADELSGDQSQVQDEDQRPGEESSLEERIVAAIKEVYDPEIPVNIYDLGLIYEVVAKPKQRHIDVKMTLTAPACPVAGTMPGMVEAALKKLDDVDTVNVQLVWDPPWTQDRMSDEARLALGLL